ncbi:MAG: CBS domain-containing protein [Kofleriaceae bacterium]
MAQQIADIMTKQVHCVGAQTNLKQIAAMMRDKKIGGVLVTDDKGKLCGIVTDRDLVVRAIAEGKDPATIKAGDVCSGQPATLREDSSIDEAIQLMRGKKIRRVPVVRDGAPVGIVSIGDLAKDRDPDSALAEISSAAPNN